MARSDYRRGYREGFKDASEGHYTSAEPAKNARASMHDDAGNKLGGPAWFHFDGKTNSGPFGVGVDKSGTATYGIVIFPDGHREVMTLRAPRPVSSGDQLTFAPSTIQFNSF
jgi:hypothetical protein